MNESCTLVVLGNYCANIVQNVHSGRHLASAHSFIRFTSRLLILSFSPSMHLLPRMNAMLDFIWTLQVQLRGTRNKWTLQNNPVHGRIRTTSTARPPDNKSTVTKPLGHTSLDMRLSDQSAKQHRCYITIRLQRQRTCTPCWSYVYAQVHTFIYRSYRHTFHGYLIPSL